MRELAFSIVYETMERNGHSDFLFHNAIKSKQELTNKEKSFLKRLSFGTIERCVELDLYLNQVSRIPIVKMDAPVRTILRMAVYEIFYMEQVPVEISCHEAVELAKKKKLSAAAGFVNGVLRNLIRRRDLLEVTQDYAKVCLPSPLFEHLSKCYGKKTAKKIGYAFLERSGEITLHIQTDRVSAEAYRKQLEARNISCVPGHYSKEAWIVSGVSDVASLPGYEEGYFFVQDESSMLPVWCAALTPGEVVVDVCSAPGGKSLHALQCLKGDGFVSARDVSVHKVGKIKENIARMSYSNVECKVWDGTIPDEEWTEKADVLLLDVPCSGIGIIGKKPEIKYHALEQADTLVALQRKICKSSLSMLKPGGVLIYSTCTINPAENEENVYWLEEHLGLRRESLNPYLPETLQNKMTAEGMLQMLPGVQKSDGFFVARLVKESERK